MASWASGEGNRTVGAGKSHGGFVKSATTAVHESHFPDPRPSVFPTTVDPWKFWGVKKGFHHHHGFSKFGHSGFFGGGGFVYGTPVLYATAPEPVVYAPPAAYAPAYAPAPMPTVVEYATGRYELRGDGITTAYQWVWIPRPPTGPPPEVAPEPAAPQSAPPARDRAIGKIYRWTDDEGVTTLTDRLENVPAKYRSRAQQKT